MKGLSYPKKIKNDAFMLSVMARKIGLWKICLTDSNAKAEAYSVEL